MMSESAPENTPETTVVFFSGDLIFTSRVKAAAERAGHRFKLSGSLPEEPDPSVRFVVLDLATKSSLVSGFADRGAECYPEAKWIAYGPHVQAARLASAKEAGIPTVMTRGQFDSKLPTLFE